MTGSGTSTNPYIPESWADFKTAIGTNDAYVEVPEGTVYDLDELEPTGISQITFNVTSFNGNGLIIKNSLYTTRLINHAAASTTTIHKIHFTNFELITAVAVFIYITVMEVVTIFENYAEINPDVQWIPTFVKGLRSLKNNKTCK